MSAPALRFKEFDGDWKSFSLLDLSSDKTLNNGVFNDQNKVGKGYKLINVLDMYIDRDIDESRLSLLDLSKQEFERNKVKYGDIFFTRSSLVKEGIAYSNVYLGSSNDITYDGHLIKLSPNLEQINSIFLNYGLKTSKVRKQLIQGGKTATMTTIGQKEIASTKIDVPFLQEQTKIASFLSAIDEKISQLTQKHQLLSQYKQGMMQKLFSQQIRFKADDGSEFGEWEGKELHQIFQIKAGGDIEKSSVSEVRTSEFSYPIFANSDKNKGFYGWANKFKYKEAVTVTGRGNLGIAVARNEPFYPIVRLLVLLPLVKQNLKFFEEQINLLDIVSESTGVPQLTAPQLSKYKVNVPSLEEQTKIANFLSSIDQKIEVVAQQIEQAKQWKKGLLQQMFI